MCLHLLLASAALSGMSTPAQVQVANTWQVTGAIGGQDFVPNCRFQGRDSVCEDMGERKRPHGLTAASLTGRCLRWGLHTSAFITLMFDDRIDGNHMNGMVTAMGCNGAFAAVRGGRLR